MTMKKLTLIACVVLAFAAVQSSKAIVNVQWTLAGGTPWLYEQNGVNYAGDGIANPQWLVELIDGGASAPNFTTLLSDIQGGNFTPIGTSVDSKLWDINAAVSDTAPLDATHANHYMYLMFFNGTGNSVGVGGTTQAGFIYNNNWISPADEGQALGMAGMDVNDPTSGTLVGGSTGNYQTGSPQGYATVAPIPEPTSLALFGLGGLLIGLRRKLRKT